MEEKDYYHMYANGEDARNLVTCEDDFKAIFNIIGVCACNCNVIVLAFSVEDSHPHILLYGTSGECIKFKKMFETTLSHHIASTRHSTDNMRLECSLDQIKDEEHLKNTGVYVIIQATKDGKRVMPYDYLWGTGSMYFRGSNHIPIWLIDDNGKVQTPKRLGDLPIKERRALLCSRKNVCDDWLVCNGFLLPDNYINVEMFERIYKSHNAFRVFSCASSKKLEQVTMRMAESRGIRLEDLEARRICEEICINMFGKKTTRHLTPQQRITVALELRRQYHLTIRQIATLSRLPESEVMKYVK